MVVDAVMMLDELLPLNMIGIKKVQGGALEDTVLVPGVAFKKTFSYAGFEMQKKTYKNPKIAMLNIELELKAEKENAEVTSFKRPFDMMRWEGANVGSVGGGVEASKLCGLEWLLVRNAVASVWSFTDVHIFIDGYFYRGQ